MWIIELMNAFRDVKERKCTLSIKHPWRTSPTKLGEKSMGAAAYNQSVQIRASL